MHPLQERWKAVPYGDKGHERCRIILEALALQSGNAWAQDLADDLDVNVKTIHEILYHLDWHGRLMWRAYPSGPARLIPWKGMEMNFTQSVCFDTLESQMNLTFDEIRYRVAGIKTSSAELQTLTTDSLQQAALAKQEAERRHAIAMAVEQIRVLPESFKGAAQQGLRTYYIDLRLLDFPDLGPNQEPTLLDLQGIGRLIYEWLKLQEGLNITISRPRQSLMDKAYSLDDKEGWSLLVSW